MKGPKDIGVGLFQVEMWHRHVGSDQFEGTESINGPTNVFCVNCSVVTNLTIPSSTLNSKHNPICYHKVREAQAARIVRIAWIEGEYNKVDILTKTTLGTGRWYDLISSIFEDECAVVFDELVVAEIWEEVFARFDLFFPQNSHSD